MGQSKGVILFQSGFFSEGEGPALEFGSWERPTSRAGPPRSRFCLSHFPPCSTTPNRIGPMRVGKSFCATARFACRIPSSVMGAGANRLMMRTTIGSGFAAVFATAAVKHSPFCRSFLRPTAITASSLAAKRYSATSWIRPWRFPRASSRRAAGNGAQDAGIRGVPKTQVFEPSVCRKL